MLAVRPFVVWGLCARYTPDAVEADPSERELVVLIRSFCIFAKLQQALVYLKAHMARNLVGDATPVQRYAH